MTKKHRFSPIFSPALFRQGISRIRLPGIAMAITVIGLNTIYPLTRAHTYRAYTDYDSLTGTFIEQIGQYPAEQIDSFTQFAPMLLLLLLFTPLLMFSMFSYLNSRQKCDFYHAIPQSRLCVFLSFNAAVYAWVGAVLLGSTLVNLLLWLPASPHALNYAEIFGILPCLLLGCLVIGSMSVLAMTLTGTTASNLLLTLLLLLLPLSVLRDCVEEYLPALIPFRQELLEEGWLRLLTPSYYYPSALYSLFTDEHYHANYIDKVFDGAAILLTALLALALLVLAAHFYHRRRSEAAEQSVSSRLVQHICRTAIALPFALYALQRWIRYGFAPKYLSILVLSLVLYLVYELLVSKRLLSMLRVLPLYLVVLLCSAALLGSVQLGAAAIRADQPDRDEVVAVTVDHQSFPAGASLTLTEETAYTTDPEVIDLIMDALEFSAPMTAADYDKYQEDAQEEQLPSASIRKTRLSVVLHTASGKDVSRKVMISWNEYNCLKEIYIDLTDGLTANSLPALPQPDDIYQVRIRLRSLNIPLENKQKGWLEFWEIFSTEYNACTLEEQKLMRSNLYDPDGSNHHLPVITVTTYRGEVAYRVSPTLCPQTVAYTLPHYYAANEQDYLTVTECLGGVSPDALFAYYQERPNDVRYLELTLRPAYDYAEQITDETAYSITIDEDTAPDKQMLQKFFDALELLTDASAPFDYHKDIATKRLYFVWIACELPKEFWPGTPRWNGAQFGAYVMLNEKEAAALIEALRP